MPLYKLSGLRMGCTPVRRPRTGSCPACYRPCTPESRKTRSDTRSRGTGRRTPRGRLRTAGIARDWRNRTTNSWELPRSQSGRRSTPRRSWCERYWGRCPKDRPRTVCRSSREQSRRSRRRTACSHRPCRQCRRRSSPPPRCNCSECTQSHPRLERSREDRRHSCTRPPREPSRWSTRRTSPGPSGCRPDNPV